MIWINTVYKGRVYSGSAGLGLMRQFSQVFHHYNVTLKAPNKTVADDILFSFFFLLLLLLLFCRFSEKIKYCTLLLYGNTSKNTLILTS